MTKFLCWFVDFVGTPGTFYFRGGLLFLSAIFTVFVELALVVGCILYIINN